MQSRVLLVSSAALSDSAEKSQKLLEDKKDAPVRGDTMQLCKRTRTFSMSTCCCRNISEIYRRVKSPDAGCSGCHQLHG